MTRSPVVPSGPKPSAAILQRGLLRVNYARPCPATVISVIVQQGRLGADRRSCTERAPPPRWKWFTSATTRWIKTRAIRGRCRRDIGEIGSRG